MALLVEGEALLVGGCRLIDVDRFQFAKTPDS
jgi:hypothetical protein